MRTISDKQLQSVILSAYLDRYRFCNTDDEYLYVTSVLLENIDNNAFTFEPRLESDPTIQQKISYILNGSGLIPLLAIVREVYGDAGVKYINSLIDKAYKGYTLKKKDKIWLKKHKDDLATNPLIYIDEKNKH